MRIITKCQVHKLVYWAPGPADIDGRLTYPDAPVEYTCRWEDRVDEMIKPDGTQVVTGVYMITQELLAVGGLVLKSTLDDLTTQDPVALGAMEVLAVAATPTLKGNHTLFEAWA